MPRPSSRMRKLLVIVMVVGLVRGLFWVFLAPVWNPVDETAHFGYVESLATGHGIPTVGEDLVSADVLRSAKESPTYYFRTRPHGPEPTDAAWGGTRHQYEGVQGPVYYLLMVPAYWLGRPFGILGALYAVRTASVLLWLAAVPLVFLLTRELFPRSPATWIAAPALLVMVQGLNANLACVSNDALVVVAGAGTLLFAVRGLREPTVRNALATGVLLGSSVVGKTTAVSLVPLIGVAWVILLAVNWSHRRQRVRWLAQLVAAATVPVAPWLVFNQLTYGAVSAAKAVEEITGNYQGMAPFSLTGLRQQWESATGGFWEFQPAHIVAAATCGQRWLFP
jgi:4-amino-4-deoxy-L-arabinose transferase-like glycosyltransferase